MTYRVLVADDEEPTRNAIKDFLEMGIPGIEVRIATGFSDAMGVVNGGYDPKCVITDYNMGGGTGVDLIKALNTCSANPSLVGIILMSGLDAEKARIELEAFGNAKVPVEFMPKPIGPKNLAEKLRQFGA